MQVSIKNRILLEGLSSLRGIVESRPTFPAHAMVLFSPSSQGCHLYTIGSEAQSRLLLTEINIQKPEKALVSVHRLYEISRNIGVDEDISISFDDNSVTVSGGRGIYRLRGMSPEDFPLSEEHDSSDGIKMSEQDLKYLIDKTDFSMAIHDPRFFLNGLFLSSDGKALTAVSTDGHRLALSSLPVSAGAEVGESIVPRNVVLELKRLLADDSDKIAELNINQSNIEVSFGNLQIVAKALNGEFPDYKKIIPTNFAHEIKLDREEFMSSLRRAAAISQASADSGVSLTLKFSKGSLKLHSRNTEGEEATVEQDSEYSGEPLDISFNPVYLSDVMRVLDTETVLLQIREADSGVRIVGVGSTSEEYIVMPLRI